MTTDTTASNDRFSQAMVIWDEYQQAHDVAALVGQVAAVDLETGEVRVVPSATDLPHGPDGSGRVPCYALFRVGYAAFWGYPHARPHRRQVS